MVVCSVVVELSMAEWNLQLQKPWRWEKKEWYNIRNHWFDKAMKHVLINLFLFEFQNYTERETEREMQQDPPSAALLTKWAQHPKVSLPKAESQGSLPVLPCRCRGPKSFGLAFPGH